MKVARALVAVCGAALLAVAVAAPAAAYGEGADHDMWQVGISFNCNDPGFCGPNLGGFWGWVEFDRSADGSTTWGDAELAECFHTVAGDAAGGAIHSVVEIESWTVKPGSAGPETFFVSGEETDAYRGKTVTYPIVDFDTEIPAVPGHYATDGILGFDAPPGVALQIQVALRPSR